MIAPSSRHALLLARAALRNAMRLHLHSVDIGRYETIADSGVLAEANMEARQCIELMDLAAAELDKQLSPP
jgi:hypothetical protein